MAWGHKVNELCNKRSGIWRLPPRYQQGRAGEDKEQMIKRRIGHTTINRQYPFRPQGTHS
eukprot:scaffold5121_cov223-Ochromonas_danica.AAC.20